MDKNQTAKEGFESLEDAAARLLERLEQRGRKVTGRLKAPDKIHEISPNAPWADKEADEGAAISASLVGPVARLGGLRRGLKAVLISANDNNAGWTSGEYDHRASPTRLYPDANSMPKIARGIHAPGDWEW